MCLGRPSLLVRRKSGISTGLLTGCRPGKRSGSRVGSPDLRAHRVTQNHLARLIEEQGLKPRRPKKSEPDFDLAWTSGDRVFVAEVKSLTAANQERQLRLGLGQVLRYAQVLTSVQSRDVVPLLVVEKEPADSSWVELCTRLGVSLLWPDNMQKIILDE